MKPNKPNRRRVAARQRGFALVISLSLMVLLTILAVGLLTLSSVSLRAAGASQARAEAEANARMALNLAIGELQVTMGPDQAISARASSIDPAASEPNLLGSWQSWHWKPGSTGPNYSDKAQKFRRWLASMTDKSSARSVAGGKAGFKEPVWLINPDTVKKPDSQSNPGAGLRGEKISMEFSKSQRGGFAWAVMDESLKAPIQLREPELEKDAKPPTKAELLARRTAPVRARPEEILPNLAPSVLGDPNKIVSLDSAVVASPDQALGKKVLSYQADVTPYSVGLLSNVADGGLKTDLTTLFESSSASPNVNGQATVYNTAADGAPRWDYIRDHYQLHRKLGGSAATGAPKLNLTSLDLKPATIGTMAAPAKERLLPVISKFQVMFSVVSHFNHLGDRIDYLEKYGVPKGNKNYMAPHLVYDPVVTLYNPYDVALTLPKLRVRVWDPPVLFGFKKNSDWLRPEFASGEFHNLARFQIANEKNKDARRWFTLLLTDSTKSVPYGGPITMMPGEVRVFSPYIEKDWTWGMETSGGYTVRSFFDWNAGNDFGNVDGRTKNQYGIETVPGWNSRAGLQTDHLSYAQRPLPTRYDFEKDPAHPQDGGWLVIKKEDTFTFEAKPGRGTTAANVPDFEVDLLAGSVTDVTRDYLRSYKFRFANPESEISSNPNNPKITRTFPIGDLLQDPTVKDAGGKLPFALLTMGAKTTADKYDASAPWLHNQPAVEGLEQNSSRVGNALDTYDVRLTEVTGFDGIEYDSKTNKGFYGASLSSSKGVSNVPMFRAPVLPASSLGELIPANLVSSAALPRVTHPFGNSRAHPLLPAAGVSRSLSGGVTGTSGLMLDHSYLLNDALWDSTFFSTASSFSGNSMMTSNDRKTLLAGFLEGKTKLFNARFTPLPGGKGSYEDQAKDLDSLGDDVLAKRMASVMGVKGPFNVNSDSVDAWKALLTSLREQQLLGWNNSDMAPAKDKTGFSRMSLPIAGDNSNGANPQPAIDVSGNAKAWAGFRALSDKEIGDLATAIVTEIRARGQADSAPSLTLGEFINRHPGGASSLHALEGILQRAINQSGINDKANGDPDFSRKLGSVSSPVLLTGLSTAQARSGYDSKTGYSAEGSPITLTQGDLLMALAPVITVRGDTFRIRAYGEARDPDGKVTAKAWCEAIVQRVPEYLDSKNTPDEKPGALEDVNEKFGRRFNITSFRWLSPEEV